MPSFPTPTPILLSFKVPAGNVEIVASDRPDTVVTVLPRSAEKRGDVASAEQTTVEFADGRITVLAPRRFNPFGPTGLIHVMVELPTGSRIEGDVSLGDVCARGRLGDCRVKAAHGEIALDETAAAELRTNTGDIVVGLVSGDAALSVSTGSVRVDTIDGSAVVKGSHGDLVLGEVTGELIASTSSGDIEVHFPGTLTTAKSAYGKVRIGDAPEGSLLLETSYGGIEVGVPEGTAAWLDVSSGHGSVRSQLQADDAPAATDKTVEVRARTSYGDIVIRRPIGRRPGDRREARTIGRKALSASGRVGRELSPLPSYW